MIPSIAYAMGPAPGAKAGEGSVALGFIPVIVMFAIFYFLLIKPQQKKQKEHAKMMDNLKEGDNIVTSGGILGVITKIKDDVVTVQIADQVKVKVERGSIKMLRDK